MSKQSGLGMAMLVAGYDLSGDIGSISSLATPLATLDVTGIDKSAHERIGALHDGNVEFVAFYNPATAREHPVLSALPTTDVAAMACAAKTLGAPAYSMIGKQINYDPTRGNDGSLTFKTQVQANGFGASWGQLLTAGLRTDTAATAGSPVDFGTISGGFVHGWVAYLQVLAFTGTDVTIKLQHSTTSGGTYSDIASGAFAAITTTTPQAQRLAVGGSAGVNEFVKATTVTTGGFTSVTFAVSFWPHHVASDI